MEGARVDRGASAHEASDALFLWLNAPARAFSRTLAHGMCGRVSSHFLFLRRAVSRFLFSSGVVSRFLSVRTRSALLYLSPTRVSFEHQHQFPREFRAMPRLALIVTVLKF